MTEEYVAVLEVVNIQKSFGNKVKVVKDVSFSVEPGEIFAFLGPNGAGKTTTIKMIVGLIAPDSGSVLVNGKNTRNNANAQKDIGAVLEGNRNIYWRMTTFENLVYFNVHKGCSLKHSKQVATELLQRFNLSEKRDTQVQYLSRGMQQKLSIAIAMAHKPKLLLLDEPTLGLDVTTTIEVIRLMKELRDEGISIVLTTHQLDVAQKLSDRIAIIDKGLIIKQRSKKDLIEEFSQDAYLIEMMETMSDETAEKLSAQVSAVVNDKTIKVAGGSAALFQAIELIKPLEIKLIERLELNLTDIFLQLTGHTIDV